MSEERKLVTILFADGTEATIVVNSIQPPSSWV